MAAALTNDKKVVIANYYLEAFRPIMKPAMKCYTDSRNKFTDQAAKAKNSTNRVKIVLKSVRDT